MGNLLVTSRHAQVHHSSSMEPSNDLILTVNAYKVVRSYWPVEVRYDEEPDQMLAVKQCTSEDTRI